MYNNHGQPEKHPELRSFCMAIYIIAGFGGAIQFIDGALFLSIILLALAWFMIKAQRMAAMGTMYASHVEWTAYTMSRGLFFLFPLALVIAGYFIWKGMDVATFKTALNNDADGKFLEITYNFVNAHKDRMMYITNICAAPPTLWWVWRCWFGFMRAKAELPIDYPDSWI